MSPLLVVELLGVFCFAVSGCLLAATRSFDIVGSVVLGGLAGLGGGITRDVIIDADVPASFDRPVYLLAVVAAVLVVRAGWITPGRLRRSILLVDAGGLALFCVSGTLIALAAGFNPVGATLMGVTTACGGGVLRDVVAREVPVILKPDSGLYAVPAAVGAGLVALLASLGLNPDHLVGPAEIAVIGLVFGIRVLALRLRWRLWLAGPAAR